MEKMCFKLLQGKRLHVCWWVFPPHGSPAPQSCFSHVVTFCFLRQPSDSYGPDGGGIGLIREHKGDTITEDIVFAPADPVYPKHRKGSKVRTSPRDKTLRKKDKRRPTKAVDSGTPPPAPRRESRSDTEDSLWYAKWWMCGFTDALRELVPKR